MLAPPDLSMIKTGNPKIYDEWEKNKKFFKARHYIFTLGLAIGILNNKKSDKEKYHDIVRLGSIRDSNTKNMINFVFAVICQGPTNDDRWKEILSYSDGGLELLWEDYQKQGIIDIAMLITETKKKWPDRIKEYENSSTKNDLELA